MANVGGARYACNVVTLAPSAPRPSRIERPERPSRLRSEAAHPAKQPAKQSRLAAARRADDHEDAAAVPPRQRCRRVAVGLAATHRPRRPPPARGRPLPPRRESTRCRRRGSAPRGGTASAGSSSTILNSLPARPAHSSTCKVLPPRTGAVFGALPMPCASHACCQRTARLPAKVHPASPHAPWLHSCASRARRTRSSRPQHTAGGSSASSIVHDFARVVGAGRPPWEAPSDLWFSPRTSLRLPTQVPRCAGKFAHENTQQNWGRGGRGAKGGRGGGRG